MFKTSDDGDGISEFWTKFLPREGFFFSYVQPFIQSRTWARVACKSYFLVGVEMGHCVPNVFIFVTEKEHNFQRNKNIASFQLKRKGKKPNLSVLTQAFCGLLSLLSEDF